MSVRQDLRLVSYYRNLGVGMFPGLWRNRVVVGHIVKLHAVFVLFVNKNNRLLY